jgi:hypothetical protein
MKINGLSGSIAYLEAKGLSKCFDAYAEHCNRADIMDIGFNANSGYVYIALENGVTIGSMLGRDVEYIIEAIGDDMFDEMYFDTYDEAINNQ